jgi:hypothetical protein
VELISPSKQWISRAPQNHSLSPLLQIRETKGQKMMGIGVEVTANLTRKANTGYVLQTPEAILAPRLALGYSLPASSPGLPEGCTVNRWPSRITSQPCPERVITEGPPRWGHGHSSERKLRAPGQGNPCVLT